MYKRQVLRLHRTEIFGVATSTYKIIPDKWSVDEILRFSYIPVLASVIESGESFNCIDLNLGPEYTREPD